MVFDFHFACPVRTWIISNQILAFLLTLIWGIKVNNCFILDTDILGSIYINTYSS